MNTSAPVSSSEAHCSLNAGVPAAETWLVPVVGDCVMPFQQHATPLTSLLLSPLLIFVAAAIEMECTVKGIK